MITDPFSGVPIHWNFFPAYTEKTRFRVLKAVGGKVLLAIRTKYQQYLDLDLGDHMEGFCSGETTIRHKKEMVWFLARGTFQHREIQKIDIFVGPEAHIGKLIAVVPDIISDDDLGGGSN